MEIVHTDDAPKAIGPYSQGVKHDGLIFISGQIPLDPVTGDIIKGDIQLAAEQAIKNFLAVLRSGGGKDVLKITLYLTNPDDFQAVNEVYGRYFSEPYPARATVFVSALPKGAPIEIEGIGSY